MKVFVAKFDSRWGVPADIIAVAENSRKARAMIKERLKKDVNPDLKFKLKAADLTKPQFLAFNTGEY